MQAQLTPAYALCQLQFLSISVPNSCEYKAIALNWQVMPAFFVPANISYWGFKKNLSSENKEIITYFFFKKAFFYLDIGPNIIG